MHTEEIKGIIREFLERLTVSVEDISIRTDETPPLFEVTTKDSGALIGVNGDNLRALNVVMKKIIEKRLGTEAASEFFLDVNGYQSRQIADLKSKARMLADRARTFKYDVEMSPMNAYERMIVHATFTDDPHIATESVGEGKVRHVILKYVEHKQSATEKSQPLTSDVELFGTV